MDSPSLKICDRCKTPTPLDKARVMPRNKEDNFILCSQCAKEFNSRSSSKALRIQKMAPLPKESYVTYRCHRCKYNFRSDSSKAEVIHRLYCPYCGKNDQLQRV